MAKSAAGSKKAPSPSKKATSSASKSPAAGKKKPSASESTKQSDADSTLRVHRIFSAPPEVLYRAFTESGARCKFLPPKGFYAEMEKNDVKVGGQYHMSFINMRSGEKHGFGGKYLELTKNKRIRISDKFDAGGDAMENTIEFRPVACGTEVTCVQTNCPVAVEFCYMGWQESLNQLADLVTNLGQ